MTDLAVSFEHTAEQRTRDRRAIRVWLYGVCLLIFAMIVVGGATRLTESGLSITEWKPIHGVIPPLSVAEWEEELEKYRQIPEYQLINKGMSLAEFKFIYWWEWSHRLLGRVIGVAFFLPLVWFWARGRVEPWLRPWLIGGFVLGGMQGVIGWWMVASGLVDRVDVSQYRLATHLTLACLILAYLLALARHLALAPLDGPARQGASGYSGAAGGLLALLCVQIFLGGLVAGLNAGLTFNSWPLMDGAWIPDGLWLMQPVWLNHFENVLTVQFQHRLTAYLLVLVAVWVAISVWRNGNARALRPVALAVVGVLLVQMTLGILTLLGHVPFTLALFHQGFIVIVLAAMVEFWIRARLHPANAVRVLG